MRRRIAVVVAPACGVLLAGAVLAYATTRTDPPPDPPPAPVVAAAAVPVVAEPVKQGNVPIYLRGIGNVQAYNTVTVRTQVQGQITEVAYKEGQTIKKGDLLVQIDPRPYQALLDQATGNLKRDQALLANAQANLWRDQQLLKNGWMTPQQVDLDKANVGQYSGNIQADEGAIKTAQVQLGFTRITSPIDGVTGIRLVDIGNFVQPSETTPLVVVTQLQPISIAFTLPETDLVQLQQAMAKGKVTALAYSQDDKTELDKGTIAVLDNQIIQTSGSVKLKANFPNPAHRLWPGALVNVHVLIETLPNALTVPATAVQQGPQGPYVYVIKPDNTADQRPVTIGQLGALQAVVTDGLQPGEQVVVNGQSRLQPNSHVTLLEGAAAQQLATEEKQQTVIP
jgi:membrane fusion protein, multidrug efflux system